MNFTSDILTSNEKIILTLRTLYSKYGYCCYKMSRFEEYGLYAANRAFLPEGNIITFTGGGGKLMALRPDVTLSIVKNTKDDKEQKRLYYNENVYRTVDGELREQMQVGLEHIGNIDTAAVGEVLLLAKQSLDVLGTSTRLDISHMGFVNGLLNSGDLTNNQKADIMRCISSKNIPELRSICNRTKADDAFLDKVITLISLCGTLNESIPELQRISVNSETGTALQMLLDLEKILRSLGITDCVNIDFSVTGDISYYNSIIFQGFIEGVPGKVLSGGRYDELLRSFGRNDSAIGFAVYPELAQAPVAGKPADATDMIGIALPKGRLGEQAHQLLKKAGLDFGDIDSDSRKLVFENPQCGIRCFWVKPSDVAIYVERGVADLGIAGKDTLSESGGDIFELLDLGLGKCRMCVAAKNDEASIAYNSISRTKPLRVATKFPNTARTYYAGHGIDIDIIKLHGSIELAPLLGLSDVIVDLVESGKTLSENDMKVTETISEISARLISNKVSYKFKHKRISKLCKEISANL